MTSLNDFSRCTSSQRIEHFFECNTYPAQDIAPERLHQAIRYSAMNGGKRIRPGLVYATGQALNLSLDDSGLYRRFELN